MHQDEGRGLQFQRALHDFPWIDRRVVDRAARLRLVGDQAVAGVEEQHAELLDLLARQGGVEIGEQPVPVVQQGAIHHLGPSQAQRRRLHGAQRGGAGLAEALDVAQVGQWRGDGAREGAEPAEQGTGDRLGVPPRQGEEEHHFEQFVVEQGLWTGREELLPHPGAMPQMSGRRLGVCIDRDEQAGHRFGQAGFSAHGHPVPAEGAGSGYRIAVIYWG